MGFRKRCNQDASLRSVAHFGSLKQISFKSCFFDNLWGSCAKIFLQCQDYPRIFSASKAFLMLHSIFIILRNCAYTQTFSLGIDERYQLTFDWCYCCFPSSSWVPCAGILVSCMCLGRLSSVGHEGHRVFTRVHEGNQFFNSLYSNQVDLTRVHRCNWNCEFVSRCLVSM